MINWINKNNNGNNIGIISPYHLMDKNFHENLSKKSIVDATTVMTSGNILYLASCLKVGGFIEKYLIDYVDHEYCLRLRKNGFSVKVMMNCILIHKLGNTEAKQILFHKISFTNHNYIRRYFITRNSFLFTQGFVVNHKRVLRLLRLMGLMAIYPLYSRYIEGWGISNSLEAKASIAVMKQAVKDYGKPEIIKSNQGSQFCCEDWISYLESEGIEIGMDGKGRAIDNIFIEQFRRSVKYNYVYLHPAGDGLKLYHGLKEYMLYYNYELHHQGIDRKTPAERYLAA